MEILLIEDNPDHADLLMECIQEAFSRQVSITWHTELLPGLELLQRNSKGAHFGMCFCDLQLPDSGIEDTINYLKNLDSPTPIIVLTSLNDEDKAKSLIQGGAQDYISKDDLNPSQIYKTCIYAIERQRQTVHLEERNRDQAAFCYSLSHDFKGPIRRIGTVLGFLKEDLTKRIELRPEEVKHFEMIENNVGVINTLVSDLYQYLSLDAARENFVPLRLNDIIEEARQLVDTDTKAYTLSVAKLPTIDGNHAQLVVLFKNLIDNSIKYCQIKPVIHIGSFDAPNDKYVIISVTDNGLGIASEKIERIFNPFQRLENSKDISGSGLGLSIVKRIIDNHNGSIGVESEINKGTTFNLHIPYIHIA